VTTTDSVTTSVSGAGPHPGTGDGTDPGVHHDLPDRPDRPSPMHLPASRSGPDIAVGALRIEDLTVTFKTKRTPIRAVRGVSLVVEPGRTVVLLGESGSGKSVSARAALRLYGDRVEVGGAVSLAGTDLFALSEAEMQSVRGRSLAFVPQDAGGSLDPLRRIGSQLVEVLRRHGVAESRKAARDRAADLLAQVGIPDPRRVSRAYPHELSGGMRQRALIAIAISCGPRALIADEPTTALDVTIQAQVLDLFARLQDDLGMGMLMVTHDVGVASQVADRVAVMYAGRLVEEGPGAAVLADPAHPYTAALLRAVPTPGIPRGGLQAIPGQPPPAGAAADATAGCAFADRCSFAVGSCRSEPPELAAVGIDHRAACPVVGGRVPMDPPTRPAVAPAGPAVGSAAHPAVGLAGEPVVGSAGEAS